VIGIERSHLAWNQPDQLIAVLAAAKNGAHSNNAAQFSRGQLFFVILRDTIFTYTLASCNSHRIDSITTIMILMPGIPTVRPRCGGIDVAFSMLEIYSVVNGLEEGEDNICGAEDLTN
jgi:hypothetical protein